MSRVSNMGDWTAQAFIANNRIICKIQRAVCMHKWMLQIQLRAFLARRNVSVKIENALVVAHGGHHRGLVQHGSVTHDRMGNFRGNFLAMPLRFVDHLRQHEIVCLY